VTKSLTNLGKPSLTYRKNGIFYHRYHRGKKIHEPYLHQDAYGKLEFFPILCGLESSTVTLIEHQECKFLEVAEIQEYELAPADYKALEILCESQGKDI